MVIEGLILSILLDFVGLGYEPGHKKATDDCLSDQRTKGKKYLFQTTKVAQVVQQIVQFSLVDPCVLRGAQENSGVLLLYCWSVRFKAFVQTFGLFFLEESQISFIDLKNIDVVVLKSDRVLHEVDIF